VIGVIGVLLATLAATSVESVQDASLPAGTAVTDTIRLTDVTASSGIDLVTTSGTPPLSTILEVKGGGLALIDFDSDGDLDLFAPNGATLADPGNGPGARLYRNDGGLRFTDVTAASGIAHRRWSFGTAVGDVDGDVGGINFPAAIGIPAANFNITGNIYGTGTVPAELSTPEVLSTTAAEVSKRLKPNYRNQDLKVFPTKKDANDIPVFPKIDENRLEANANGLLINGAGRADRVARIHQGNLTVEGTQNAPFQINGEVFVKGNLYIKGYYQGRGTIYARNILVVNDIVSIDCINPATCPFPLPEPRSKSSPKPNRPLPAKKQRFTSVL